MTQRLMRRARAASGALLLLSLSVVAAAALAAEPTSLPLKTGSSTELWQAALKAIFIAVLCLALVAAALYAWRHRIRMRAGGVSAPDAAASVEWARRVSPRTTLLVVRWQGRQYLLAESGTNTRVIDSRVFEEPRA